MAQVDPTVPDQAATQGPAEECLLRLQKHYLSKQVEEHVQEPELGWMKELKETIEHGGAVGLRGPLGQFFQKQCKKPDLRDEDGGVHEGQVQGHEDQRGNNDSS